MKLSARPQFVTIWITALWGIVTVLLLLEVGRHTNGQIKTQAQSWANSFNVAWITRPDDFPHLFRTMKSQYFDNLQKNQQFFRDVVLTWVHPTQGEVILYPTEKIGEDVHDLPQAGSILFPIRTSGDSPRDCGYLRFQLDPWNRWGTTISLLLAAFNVLLVLLFLIYWFGRISTRYRASQSELQQKKRELIQLEQLALAGRLSAGLLHDLKKPVIHIREECTEPSTKDPLPDIREQSELFLSMLHDSGLEGFARRRSTQPECCDVIDLMERSLRLVEYERADVEVRLQVEGDVPFVWALPTRLMQVFSNLILNAYQAMHGHGVLTVEIHPEEGSDGNRAVVVVRDTGPGIPPGDRAQVFEPFYTTGREGSGLGLYIIRTILEDLGGDIQIGESEEGGALFRVALPEGRPPHPRERQTSTPAGE